MFQVPISLFILYFLCFTIYSITGGSLVKFLTTGLLSISTDFDKWKIFFCDERMVPTDDPDSTLGLYKKDLVGKVNLKEDQFVTIKQGVSGNTNTAIYSYSCHL